MLSASFSFSAHLERLLEEIQDEKQSKSLAVEDIGRQLRDTQKELENQKIEYQAYKVKAHAALQQSASSALEPKILELEQFNHSLESKVALLESSLADALGQLKAKDADLLRQKDDIQTLSEQLAASSSNTRETIMVKQELESLKEQALLKEEEWAKCKFFSNTILIKKQLQLCTIHINVSLNLQMETY